MFQSVATNHRLPCKFGTMLRRVLFVLCGAVALSGTAVAQSPRVVGYLGSETAEIFEGRLVSFRACLLYTSPSPRD